MAVNAITTEFASRLAPMFKAKGFRKTSATWRRDCDYLTQVFNIQKSQWGDQFYLNLGIYLRDPGNESRPTEYRCHVRCRAERLLEDEELQTLRECLDFDTPLDREISNWRKSSPIGYCRGSRIIRRRNLWGLRCVREQQGSQSCEELQSCWASRWVDRDLSLIHPGELQPTADLRNGQVA